MAEVNGIFGGIGNHDVYLGENQCAYTENLFIRDPEYVCLGAKPTNLWERTEDDLIVSYGDSYYGSREGKIIDGSGNLDGTLGTYSVTAILKLTTKYYASSGDDYVVSLDAADVGTATQWEATTSYNGTYKTRGINKRIKYGADEIFFNQARLINTDAAILLEGVTHTNSSIISFAEGINGAGIRSQGADFRLLSNKGEFYYWDGALSNGSVVINWKGLYGHGSLEEGLPILIAGHDAEDTSVYTVNGITKQLLAKAESSGNIGGAKRFQLGRKNQLNLVQNHEGSRLLGNGIVTSHNGQIYIVGVDGIYSFGEFYRGMPRAWNVETTKNHNNEVVDEIGLVTTVESTSTGQRLYFSWKKDTKHGVDYYDLTNSAPTTFKDSGVFYSQRFTFGRYKAIIDGLRVRADTDTGQTVKVSVSVDGGSYELVDTLNNTDSKTYHAVNSHFEGHSIQFKFELTTDDDSLTPKFYGFTFNPTVQDGY